MIQKARTFISQFVQFVSQDIWRITEEHTDWRGARIFNFIRIFILAVRNFIQLNISARASALTYSTLLAIVPILAILFAIARGFGFQNIVQSELFKYFSGQKAILTKALEFADSSLKYAQGGIFVGVGIILMLYTVVRLIFGVEYNFNDIWNVKRQRSYYRQFTDYLALILIVPVFMICNSGITLLIGSSIDKLYLLDHILAPLMKAFSFLLIVGLFTFIYIYIPNTKVKFGNAFFGALIAGTAFQLFQMLYISGQIWITSYNAIYGSFAALPLLLLWLQLSWLICLFGMLLTHAAQNVKKFSFEKESRNISRRFKDFFTMLVASLIIKRFEAGQRPYTADELSEKHKIPSKLTGDILFFLQQIGILVEVADPEKDVPTYMPAFDIHKITVAEFFRRINEYGSEDFNKDWRGCHSDLWDTLSDYKEISYSKYAHVLLKDL